MSHDDHKPVDVFTPWYGNGTGLRRRDLTTLAVDFASEYIDEFSRVAKLETIQERRFRISQRSFGDFLERRGALIENPFNMIDASGELLPRSNHTRRGLMQRMSQIRLAMNDLTKVGAHGFPVFSIETPPSRNGERKLGQERLIIKLIEPIVKDHLPKSLQKVALLIDNTIRAGRRFVEEASAKENVFDPALLIALRRNEESVYTTMSNAVVLFESVMKEVEGWQNKQLRLMKQLREIQADDVYRRKPRRRLTLPPPE